MSEPIYEPEYMCWHERDFWADRYVINMTKLQRHFYRALLQAAFFCSTRPYLPDDDEELCTLADADNLETWQQNRKVVLRKFQPFTDGDGRKLLRHKRLDRDWEQTLTYVEQKRKGGKARQARAKQESADAEQVLSDAAQTETENRNLKLQTKTKKEIETKTEIQTETETEIPIDSVSDSAPSSIDGFRMEGKLASAVGTSIQAEELAALWAQARETNGNEVSLDDREPEEFLALLERGVPFHEIKQVLLWLPKSSYWDKPGEGKLEGPLGFRRAYSAIRKSYENYKRKVVQSKKGPSQAEQIPPTNEQENEFRKAETVKTDDDEESEEDPDFG
jgi:hypothetical protein